MMVTRIQHMTPEEFLLYEEQHPDVRFDFIDGELVEVSPKPLHGWIQVLIIGVLIEYLKTHPIGYLHSEVLHVLGGEKFMPDVSVNRHLAHDAAYFTEPPLLAVEIRSDTQSRASQRRKAESYIRLGTAMVWLVMPDESIEVYTPGHKPIVYRMDETLDGGDVLPGFQIAVQAILGRD